LKGTFIQPSKVPLRGLSVGITQNLPNHITNGCFFIYQLLLPLAKQYPTMSNTVDSTIKKLGRNLREAREEKELRQADVNEKIGITLVTLRKIEAGHNGVSIWSYAKYAEVLGLDFPTELLPLVKKK